MNNMRSKVRIDLQNRMWVDIYDGTIQDIHRACLMGGQLVVYQIDELYYISYHHTQGNIHVLFVGVTITKEQYDQQIMAWNGKTYYLASPGTELLLIDNSYFI
jgi:hypothetical protein